MRCAVHFKARNNNAFAKGQVYSDVAAIAPAFMAIDNKRGQVLTLSAPLTFLFPLALSVHGKKQAGSSWTPLAQRCTDAQMILAKSIVREVKRPFGLSLSSPPGVRTQNEMHTPT